MAHLSGALSKRIEYLGRSVSFHFMHHNFARVDQALRVAPAMEPV